MTFVLSTEKKGVSDQTPGTTIHILPLESHVTLDIL